MKKVTVLSLAALAVLLVGATAFVVWKRLAPPSVRPDALLPPETLLLAEAVDLPRTALRWQGTELYALFQEPEVQIFLEKPMATHPLLRNSGAFRQQLVKFWPRQIFASVVSMDGATPKMIGGFSFLGNAQVAEAWLAEPRRAMKSAHPAGKAEVVLHGRIEVETYTDRDFVLAETTYRSWHLFANDRALLEQTLDRLDAAKEARAPTLAGDADYQKSFAKLPADSELRVFARTGVFLERLQAAAAAGDPAKVTGLEGLRKMRALAAISKIEGGQFHDAVFSLAQDDAKHELLARAALELTDPDTAGFYAAKFDATGFSAIPSEMLSAFPFVATLDAALKTQKSTMADLPAIFGPEWSIIVPRPKAAVLGTLALSLRDSARAAQLAEALTAPALGEQAWVASEEDGLKIITAPESGAFFSVAPVLTVTDRYWLLSTTTAAFQPLTNREESAPQLDHTAAYRELAGAVVAPTQSFGYFDVGAIVATYYASLKPLLALGLVGSEESGQYFDAGKLPSGATLSRHLGALVTSQAVLPTGSLWESRGNLSIGQAILAGGAAYFSSGAELPAVPGFAKPAAPPPATPAPAPVITPDTPAPK